MSKQTPKSLDAAWLDVLAADIAPDRPPKGFKTYDELRASKHPMAMCNPSTWRDRVRLARDQGKISVVHYGPQHKLAIGPPSRKE